MLLEEEGRRLDHSVLTIIYIFTQIAKVEIANQMSRIEQKVSDFDLLLKDKKYPICEHSIDSEGFLSKSLHLKNEQEKLREAYDSIVCRVNGLDDLKEELEKFNQLDIQRNY